MATTIKSTNLDFKSIKNNLKTFLAEQDEFKDYNFEASGLSNILDVLAYNTHYNALTANFALNESFLGTAQLRSSLISLAEGIGYIPKSKTAARAIIQFSINLTSLSERPVTVSLAPGVLFESSVDNVVYTFQTRETVTATDDGSGIYQFKTADGSADILVYEGSKTIKTFIADAISQGSVYVIPDKNMDIDTAIIRVYESSTSSAFSTYTNLKDATLINDQTAIYILKESPNGYYELSFGDGRTFGVTPLAGYRIEVDYLTVAGAAANDGDVFAPVSVVNIGGTNYNISTSTVTNSIGGDSKESEESIRTNAPFQYATQNRMVTADDYSSLVLRNFSTLIKDISSYGGENALNPEFGAVYMSIVFEDDVTSAVRTATKNSIQELIDQLAVVSFAIRFADPITTHIESNVFFQFNPKLTTLSMNTVVSNVDTVVSDYFNTTTGKFNQAFRRSNLLSLVDDISPAILSSRMEVKMQQRIVPLLGKPTDHNLRYPVSIAAPDDEFHRLISTAFVVGNKTVRIRNKLKTNKLEVVTLDGITVVIDNVGSYNPVNGTVSIVGLNVATIIGGTDYIKISVVPANQSAVAPQREDILKYDQEPSFSSAVVVSST